MGREKNNCQLQKIREEGFVARGRKQENIELQCKDTPSLCVIEEAIREINQDELLYRDQCQEVQPLSLIFIYNEGELIVG